MKHAKRWMCGLSALAMAASMLGAAVPVSAASVTGDLNGDGNVDLVDAILTLQAYTDEVIVGMESPLSAEQKTAADVNQDGKVDLADALFILMYYTQNTLTGSETSWEDIMHPPTNLERAYTVLEKLMDGMVQHDVDALLTYSDLREIMQLGADGGLTEEELRAELEEESSGIESYEILGGIEDSAALARYNKEITELRKGAEEALAEETDAEARAEMARMLRMFQTLDALCVFEVQAMVDGEPETETLYVACKNGRWYVDTLIVSMVLEFVTVSKQSVANMAARSVYNAFNSAAIDLDLEDYPVGKLDGDYYFTGADFENLTRPGASKNLTEQEMLNAMCDQAALYFSEITELSEIAVHLDGGVCRYSAVGTDYEDTVWFGCYPNRINAADQDSITTIAQALEYAKIYE